MGKFGGSLNRMSQTSPKSKYMILKRKKIVRGRWKFGEAVFARPKFNFLSFAGFSMAFYHRKNSLYVVVNKFIEFRFVGLLVKALSGLCDGSRLGVFFKVSKIKPKKAKLVTAHNYKKCDRQILGSNKINKLQVLDLKKSVVRFGLVDCSGSVRGLATLPPIENSGRRHAPSHLLPAINCKDFLRVFSKGLWLVCENILVFGFRKVGGAGGVR